MESQRTEPLSIESLLKKQREEKEAASKVRYSSSPIPCHAHVRFQPKFLSKEERAKLAIAKRAQEIREQKEKDESSKRDREVLEREASELSLRERSQPSRHGAGRC